jgi:hypothetical protein
MVGVLIVLFMTVLAGFGMVMLHLLGLGLLPSLWFFSVFALGFMVSNLIGPKLESRGQNFKLRLVFVMLALVLTVLAWRLTVYISVLEVGLYLLLAGFAFGLNWSALQKRQSKSQKIMLLIGFLSILVFGFLLATMISGDFAPRAERIKNVLTVDERAQLEVLKLQQQLMGSNSDALKRQLKAKLGQQLKDFGRALKNDSLAQKTLLEDPSTPTSWREILEPGGLEAVTAAHFLKQKINLEKAFRDEDPRAIRDLLSSSEIPAWVRSDLERGGLKDWVHRRFDRERLTIENAIQNADPVAISVLLKSPQTRPELRAVLKAGGVQVSIQKRLTNLRLALKKAIETGDTDAVSLVFGHGFTPKSIRELFKDGALQPQIKLEIGTNQKAIIGAFLKSDPQAIKQLKALGLAKTNLPTDFTVPVTVQESRTQLAIKQLLEQASKIRAGFLTRRTLLIRAIQNDDQTAVKTLCPECTKIKTPDNKSGTSPSKTVALQTPAAQESIVTTETTELPESLKVYLQNGGFRTSIKAKYTAQYQLIERAINSGDMTKVLSLLENPKMPSDVTAWITKLNLSDIVTIEARAAQLQKAKSILDKLQQVEIKSAVLAALEVVKLTLEPLEISELEGAINQQVIDNALNETLPAFDAAASKIQTRAVDVALQGALIALTVNEKAAGNAAVQTLINRAQSELANEAPKTVKTIFASTFKAARAYISVMRQKLFSVIDGLSQAQKEAFVLVLRKTFAILALVSLLGVGLSLIGSQTRVLNQRKIIR